MEHTAWETLTPYTSRHMPDDCRRQVYACFGSVYDDPGPQRKPHPPVEDIELEQIIRDLRIELGYNPKALSRGEIQDARNAYLDGAVIENPEGRTLKEKLQPPDPKQNQQNISNEEEGEEDDDLPLNPARPRRESFCERLKNERNKALKQKAHSTHLDSAI